MFAAALFDMDGLLVDSEPLWRLAQVQVFGAYGVPLREEHCAKTSGLRLDEVVVHWRRHFGFEAVATEVLVAQIVEAVIALIRARAVAKPGVHTVLERVRSRGLAVALASSSAPSIIEAVLETLGIGTYFALRMSAQGLEHGKPHPAVFLQTARILEVEGPECVVFEDSIFGVVAAKAARMACVAVPDDHQRGDPRYVLADATLDSLELVTDELLDRLDRHRGVG
jgi:mannitol-1-/sugar-/sorbitol-6-/2-deoxyglucose-6-phosphatase